MWHGMFTFTNLLALAAWVVLVFLPRTPFARSAVMYLGAGLLCLLYTLCFALFLSGTVDNAVIPGAGQPGASSIEGVRALFMSDGGVVIGWTHYLAFDLFIGQWISRDADAKGFSRIAQAPVLLLTFLVGPVGLLTWLIVRERRARAAGRPA